MNYIILINVILYKQMYNDLLYILHVKINLYYTKTMFIYNYI